MRMLAICGAVLVAGACRAPANRITPSRLSSQITAADSLAIVRSAWRTVTARHASRRAVQLWSLATPNTVGIVPLSQTVTDALLREGISVIPRRQAGDDTVVFHIARWQADPDSGRVILEIHSDWTSVLRAGARSCRAGSGYIEQVRVTRLGSDWRSERRAVMHGDATCVPH